ncbi:MAG: HAMP domain-containing histidine kinase [Bacteroidetes bacterium]|nr:HAMP domain-containing histidine kinase [Bacteroidota bacterium]
MLKKWLQILKFPDEERGLSIERRAVLSNRLILLILALSFVYYLIDRLINSQVTHLIFIAVSLICVIALVINGLGYYKQAKIIGLLMFNFVLYNLSASQPFNTGVHLHQVTAAFVAMILFGYEERNWGIAFTLLTIAALVTAFFTQTSLIPYRTFTDYQTSVLFMANLTVFAAINIYITYMILRLNYKVERALMIRNQELEKTNVELDRFVYSASHDLRAPLNSISGLLNLQRLDPSSTAYVDMIQSRVTIMDKFIRDIIDYSRNSRTAIVKETFRLREVIDEIVDVLKVSQLKHSVAFQVEVDAQLEITSDLPRLRVVLNNLISNAMKYSDGNKADSFIRIRAWQELNQTMMVVEDNGIGIDAALQPKIFEMFFRATTVSSGSGLGLYIVKESLEKIKGTITLHSEMGKGTTFRVVLPNEF